MGLFDMFKKGAEHESRATGNRYEEGGVCAPVSGEAVQLGETSEPLFSSEAMGKGIAIKPANETVFAPVSGTVTALVESSHAVGLLADDGCEVLVHIGIDTVEMAGDGFSCRVSQGEHVSLGDSLIDFSREKIAAAGFDDTVFVVVTNTDAYASVTPVGNGPVKAGDVVVRLTK